MNSSSMLINGQMVNPKQDPVINPALGEAFATCARATTAHVNDAVEAAALAFKAWRKDEAFRRQKLSECAAALQGRASEIGQLLSQEQGKPLSGSKWSGIGYENGKWGYDEFTELQVVNTRK
jgi:acyl-CoA reductase-like NAD-dependent aldehyde dehydrogenase